MELTASKTAACTMARAREARVGAFCLALAPSMLSFLRESSAIAFHSRTTSADNKQRSSRTSTVKCRRAAGDDLRDFLGSIDEGIVRLRIWKHAARSPQPET